VQAQHLGATHQQHIQQQRQAGASLHVRSKSRRSNAVGP
jgi:hypothetical protein